MKLQFSGHESFICKHFWLKKGYDLILKNGSINDESSVVELGVGKNMVTSILFWLKAFGIIDSANRIIELGHYIFNSDTGKDPYIENIGTLWLLHYNLIKTNKASIYNLLFNEFRKGRTEFTKDQFASFVLRYIQDEIKINSNTIYADIAVLLRSYLTADFRSSKADIEDDFSNLLADLELLQSFQMENAEDKIVEWYKIENTIKPDLPAAIVLFTIIDNERYSNSIAFRELLTGENSPGSIFALNEDGLFQKIEQLALNSNIVYKDTAGVKELQIKKELDKFQILDEYYGN